LANIRFSGVIFVADIQQSKTSASIFRYTVPLFI